MSVHECSHFQGIIASPVAKSSGWDLKKVVLVVVTSYLKLHHFFMCDACKKGNLMSSHAHPFQFSNLYSFPMGD